MANLFICPFKHEKVSAEGYSAGDSIQQFRRRLETVKESGICWFESNNGHKPPMIEMRITQAIRAKLSWVR